MSQIVREIGPDDVRLPKNKFQRRCLDATCYLHRPIPCVYRETADSLGEQHVAETGHRVVIEEIEA